MSSAHDERETATLKEEGRDESSIQKMCRAVPSEEAVVFRGLWRYFCPHFLLVAGAERTLVVRVGRGVLSTSFKQFLPLHPLSTPTPHS